MVKRTAALVAAICYIAATSYAGSVRAQSLQRLTVESFDLSTDAPSPRVDVPFHLILTLRVRERLPAVENLNLPVLAALELLGDERETSSGPRGTLYREMISVVAHDGGVITLAPATLQAIDARDGRAKQWYTNGLTLHVVGGLPRTSSNVSLLLGSLFAALRSLAWLPLWALGLGCIVILAVLVPRRAPPRILPSPAPAPAAQRVPERSRRQQVQDALAVLRTQPTRTTAVAVRVAIWRMIGATEGETLADVLRRPEAAEDSMRALLVALERSAFTHDEDLDGAIDDARSALERYEESAA
jgi:hypothetical protein